MRRPETTPISLAPVGYGFARRCARYLSRQGCTPSQIHDALIEELRLTRQGADHIVATLAA